MSSTKSDRPSDISFLKELLENPDSPIALPGKIYLQNHDCLHSLLNRGFPLEDEAFIIGFTMANDVKNYEFHLLIFKFISINFYPKNNSFKQEHMSNFYSVFLPGKEVKFKNFHSFNFSRYYSKTLPQIRAELGLIKI